MDETFRAIVNIFAFIGLIALFVLYDSIVSKNRTVKSSLEHISKAETSQEVIVKKELMKVEEPFVAVKKVNRKNILDVIKSMKDNAIYITFLENNQILINDSQISTIIKDLGRK